MNSRAQILAILYVLGTFTFVSVKADIIILQYGDIITGQVLKQNEDGVDIQTSSGKVHWPAKLIKEVRKAGEESTTNRIPTWVRIISQLTTNTWVHDIKQIPATVIDNGILKDVPYISFRCNSGGYEMNIYGDLDKPACIEIGVVGYLVKNDGAKFNCVQFISSVLSQDDDKEAVRLLGWTPKGIRKSNGLTFESTLPDEADSYGGCWISIYDEKALDNARASGPELLAITQPKIKPKVVVPAATTQNYYWSDNDIGTYAQTSQISDNGGMVYVHGYTRANGTYVSGYYRNGR